jgi:hypothetical protein
MVALRWSLLVLTLLAASAARVRAEPLDEPLWAEILQQHTRAVGDAAGTRVDYAALARSPDWRRLLRSLSRVEPGELQTRGEQLAFWINAYNILAIDMVVRHYPVDSIRDIGSPWRPVWDLEAGSIGGSPHTLDRIEHGILRPMGEPRIHLAIVCASTSCPSLRREPFTAAHLDAQLDDAARSFLASEAKGLRIEARGIRISRIFDWFGEDFEAGGGVLAFVRRYAPPGAQEAVRGPVRHLDYDWSLNGLDAR